MEPVIKIKEGDIATVVALSKAIPEFDNPHGVEEYEKRLTGVKHLILIAIVEGQIAGFKVGYERGEYFYSWMGGVLPAFRRFGIAKALAETQESWAFQEGYRFLQFTTRNRHKAMLVFALLRGFYITGLEPREDIVNSRIFLEKRLG